MNTIYCEAIERAGRLDSLFRKFLESSAASLDVNDLTGFHLLVLYTIGPKEISYQDFKKKSDLFVTNPHYCVKVLNSKNYLNFIGSLHDGRVTYYQLTSKGLDIYHRLNRFLEDQFAYLEQTIIPLDEIKKWICTLTQLESFLLNSVMRSNQLPAELTA